MYQEYFQLPQIDGSNIQVATFCVSGFYAGSNIRIDESQIVISGSDLPTLRVINDQEFEEIENI